MLLTQEIQAVLFDIDGTLLATFDFIYGAFDHALTVHGIALPEWSREVYSSKMGGPLEQCYRSLAPEHDPLSLAAAHREFQSNNLHLARLFPGTEQVLDYVQKKQYKIAAITTRSKRTSVRSLEQTGIAHYFDLVLSFEDVSNAKPDPEPIIKAGQTLGVRPAHSVMIGDTYADILCGKNAGAQTVGALYGFGGKSLLELGPDESIDDITQLLTLL